MSRSGENIYKRKDGRWEGRYIKSYLGGTAKYGYIYGKTYKDVKSKMSVICFASDIDDKILFSDIAMQWLSSVSCYVKDSTVAKYRNTLNNHLLPFFQKYSLTDIDNDAIQLFVDKLVYGSDKSFSSKTISDIVSVLRCIRKYCIKKEYSINFNVEADLPRYQKKPLRVFTLYEQNLICKYLLDNQSLSNLGIILCLNTGIRLGELCALRWEDYNKDEKIIHICRTLQRIQCNNGINRTQVLIAEPKSSCSERIIPVPEFVCNLLDDAEQISGYILTGNDSYIEPRTMQNRFKAVLQKCNIPNAKFHTLRHTFATRCVELGFDIKSLSEILGHANVNITLNRYVHPSMELKRKNMDKLSQLIAVNR